MAKSKATPWLEPDGLLRLTAWARDGLTHEQIAHNCGITTGTLYEWKKKYPEIAEALKKGKAWADTQVENALYKRAVGYEFEEVTYEDGKPVKRVTKHVSPDVTAQIFWLKNRRPDLWRDRRDNTQDSDADERRTGVVMMPEVTKEDE